MEVGRQPKNVLEVMSPSNNVTEIETPVHCRDGCRVAFQFYCKDEVSATVGNMMRVGKQ
jgi:hypothetical protein